MQIVHIYGAGLLARGFVAPLLHNQALMYFFDPNIERRMALDDRWFPVIWKDHIQQISPVVVGDPSQVKDCEEPDLIITCVGPNGFPSLIRHFMDLKPTAPILTLENAPGAAHSLCVCGLDAYSGIASVSVPDPGIWIYQFHRGAVLGDHHGQLFVPVEFLNKYDLRGNGLVPVRAYTDPKKAWSRKILLHLAPHALCAYLGMSRGYESIHNVMDAMDGEITAAVQPLIEHLTNLYGMRNMWDEVWEKETLRFGDSHLADSVYRVGRNPRLKVSAGERLLVGLHVGGGPLWEEAIATALCVGYGEGFEMGLKELPMSEEIRNRIKEISVSVDVPSEFLEYFPEAM